MQIISNLIIPLLVLLVVLYGISKKIAVYDTFVAGAKESFEMIGSLFPCMLGMILGVNLLLNSGILDFVFLSLNPFFSKLQLPVEILPMAFLRSISGSTTLAIMNSIFEQYGPDSMMGMLASVIQGSTDTTFYVLTLYFGSVGISKTKYALKVGLLADLVGIVSSFLIVRLFFGP